MLFIIVPILSAALLGLNLLLAPSIPDEAKLSGYECGFNMLPGQTRSTFHIHFFIVALLFLIFDLEVLLLYPLAVTLYQVSVYGFTVAIIFFIVLTIGFVLEIGSGAINLSTSTEVNTLSTYNINHPLIQYAHDRRFINNFPKIHLIKRSYYKKVVIKCLFLLQLKFWLS